MEGWKDTFGEQYTEDQIKALNEELNKLKIESKEIGFNEIDIRAFGR